jgi:Na+-translocating ferredoxin:NAD+ oxidoreductase subunit A
MVTSVVFSVFSAALVNNAVLSQLLAMRAGVDAVEHRWETGRIALATGIALIAAAAGTWAIERWLLAPGGLLALSLLAQVLLIAFFSTLSARACQRAGSEVGSAAFCVAIIANVAMLGLVLLNSQRPDTLVLLIAKAIGTALGFALVLVLMEAMGDRLHSTQVPAPLRGIPIAVLSAGLMALAFMGFFGLDR